MKVHRASALPLVSLKGPVVEETEDASRSTEVLLCWVLPEQCWKTALLPGRVIVRASAFCLLLETQIRLADVLSMHQGRSLKKH